MDTAITTILKPVLTATGYMLPDGAPVPGLLLGPAARAFHQGHTPSEGFVPDAVWGPPQPSPGPDGVWTSSSALRVYFKAAPELPAESELSSWRRELWNKGFAPLLWVVSPERIELYNGFGTPVSANDAAKHRLKTFKNIESKLRELDALAGRLAMETGQFWVAADPALARIDRKTSVDQKLLSDLRQLEAALIAGKLERNAAQALIGQAIFTQYLIDRKLVSEQLLRRQCGVSTLPEILRSKAATAKLFRWLTATFNGDMFPPSPRGQAPLTRHLARVADFLAGIDPNSGQQRLFPYQFEVIPVELISSIYEQFAHSATAQVPKNKAGKEVGNANTARKDSVHYTRLSLVSLVLDEVMTPLKGTETVLDLSCGSGVFLVEALRRLVQRQAKDKPLTRAMIRKTLHQQIYGVDISEAAVRVAAFSLYLAAIELDPDPAPPAALKFKPLIGKSLLVDDAYTVARDGNSALAQGGKLSGFDLIVGNPPWSFKGKAGTATRRGDAGSRPTQTAARWRA